jgi:signal transduction histidine kinase
VQKRNLRLSVAVGRGEDDAPPPESEPCVVDGDPDRLFQGVLNLLSNATKYACASVDLRVRPADDAVEVIVADDGDGIHPDDQDIIFQPFTQARRTGPQPGSGLGLAIARRIVEEHGGTLAVDSEPGEGATFRVCLPVREPSASGERTPEKESPPPATGCDEPELDSGRPKATSPSIQDPRSAP